MEYLPLFHRVRDRDCLLVGAGAVALRKAAQLRAAGARLRVVAPEAEPSFQGWAQAGELTWLARPFRAADMQGVCLAVAATAERDVNRAVAEAATAQGIPVNVVDDPQLCSAIMPAVVDRSPVLVAISTGASAPTLARLLRGRVETAVPERYGQLAKLARELRSQVHARLPAEQRRAFWEGLLQGEVAERVLAGELQQARQLADRLLQGELPAPPTSARLCLVHAGPGELDQVSLGALRELERSDLVLHDGSPSAALLGLCRRDGRRERLAPQALLGQALHALGQAAPGQRLCVLRVGPDFDPSELAVLAGVPYSRVRGMLASSSRT